MPSHASAHFLSPRPATAAVGAGMLPQVSQTPLPRLPPLQSAIGMRFGRYTLLRRLAQGGMAEVWLADLPSPDGFGRKVALKHIHAALAQKPEFIQLFQEEARLGLQLDHPNIVSTLEYGEEQGSWFLAMDYVAGASLGQLIRTCITKGRLLPLPVVLEILSQLCLGLQYLHELLDAQGRPLMLVHRDIKPGNVLIDRYGTVKLTDFGIARAALRVQSLPGGLSVRGTPAYMAPEQAHTLAPVDARADLYALGLLWFELLCNQRLYLDAESAAGLDAIRQGQVQTRLKALEGHIPPPVRVLLERLLHPDPDKRFPSAAALLEVLQPFLNRAQAQLSRSAKSVLGELVAWVERAELARRGGAGGNGLPLARGTDPAPSCLEEPCTPLEATVVQDRLAVAPPARAGAPSCYLIDPSEERTIVAEMTRAAVSPGQPVAHPPGRMTQPPPHVPAEPTQSEVPRGGNHPAQPTPEPTLLPEDGGETTAALAALLAGLRESQSYALKPQGGTSQPGASLWSGQGSSSGLLEPGSHQARAPERVSSSSGSDSGAVSPSAVLADVKPTDRIEARAVAWLKQLSPQQAVLLGIGGGLLLLLLLAGGRLLLQR